MPNEIPAEDARHRIATAALMCFQRDAVAKTPSDGEKSFFIASPWHLGGPPISFRFPGDLIQRYGALPAEQMERSDAAIAAAIAEIRGQYEEAASAGHVTATSPYIVEFDDRIFD